MRVQVRENNIDKALRMLRRKMMREGLLAEIRHRVAYEKPSDARRRRAKEGERRARKAEAKRNTALFG